MGSTFSTPAVVSGTIITQAIMDELKTQINNENLRRGFGSLDDVINTDPIAGTNITSSIFTDFYTAIEDYRAKSVVGTIASHCACNCNYCTCQCNYCTCNCNYNVSDMRLKTNIKFIKQQNNINIYSFNYIWNTEKIEYGVMAQEIIKTKYKDAVLVDNAGFYKVNYSKLPITIN